MRFASIPELMSAMRAEEAARGYEMFKNKTDQCVRYVFLPNCPVRESIFLIQNTGRSNRRSTIRVRERAGSGAFRSFLAVAKSSHCIEP